MRTWGLAFAAGCSGVSQFNDRVIAGICDQEARCYPESWYRVDGDAGCRELVAERFGLDDLKAKDCFRYDAEAASACLDDLDAMTCEERATDFGLPQACTTTWAILGDCTLPEDLR